MTNSRPGSRLLPVGMVMIFLAVGLIYLLSPILLPFVLALLLAYVCRPLVACLTRGWITPALASLLVLLILTGLAFVLCLLVVPMLYQELNLVLAKLPSTLAQLKDAWGPFLQQNLGVDLNSNLNNLRDMLQQNMGATEAGLQKLLRSASEGGLFLLGVLVTLLLVPVVLFYLLKDWTGLLASLISAVPLRYREPVLDFAQEVDSALGQFLRGQLMVMAVMSVFYSTGLMLVGLHSGLAIGILTGLLVFIPYVGVFTGFVLAVLAALVQGPDLSLLWLVMGVYAAGHALEGTLVTPRLVGDRIGLHPVMVIFSLMAFGKLLGFFGILIALPASAVLRVVIGHVKRLIDPDSGTA